MRYNKIQNPSILLIHTAFPGDIILSIPLIKATHNLCFPKKLTVLTTPTGKEILEGLKEINSFIVYDKKNKNSKVKRFLQILFSVRKEKFDIAIIPHRYFRSALIAFWGNIHIRIGFFETRNFLISLLYTKRIKRIKNKHEIERNLDLLLPLLQGQSFPKSFTVPKTEIPFTKENKDRMEKLFQIDKFIKQYILIAPCSNWFTKAWPASSFTSLIKVLLEKKYFIVLTASSSEQDIETCSLIYKNCKHENLINLAGQTSFRDLSFLCSNAKAMISNDSAPMHIAAAHEIPLIAIFGSTVPSLGFAPYSKKHIVIEKNINCRPCGLHGKTKCPKKHFKCMLDIQVRDIISAIDKLEI